MDIDNEKEKNTCGVLCADCLSTVPYFQNTVREFLLDNHTCCVCNTSSLRGLCLEDMTGTLSRHIPNHYSLSEEGEACNYSKSLQDVVGEFTIHNHDLCGKLADLLTSENARFIPGRRYKSKIDNEYLLSSKDEMIKEWEHISFDLKHKRRFTNKKSLNFYEGLISTAIGHEMINGKLKRKDIAVTTVAQGSVFYRARLVKDQKSMDDIVADPIGELGAPPDVLATNSRMSPPGISFLYTANDVATCIAEIHPYAGDRVAVAKFTSGRDLVFFDFTALDDFSDESVNILTNPESKMFKYKYLIPHLHQLIAKPVRANDTSYIDTQVLAETIRNYKYLSFDGIIFRSTQNNIGINYVLFGGESIDDMGNESHECNKFDLILSNDTGVAFYTISGMNFIYGDC